MAIILLATLNAKSQDYQQQIDALNKKVDAGQKADSIKIDALNKQNVLLKKADSLNLVTQKIQDAQILSLRYDSIKKGNDIKLLQKYDSISKITFVSINLSLTSFARDTAYKAYQIRTMRTIDSVNAVVVKNQGYRILGLVTDSAYKTRDINNLQRYDSTSKATFTAYGLRLRSLEIDSAYQAKQILALQQITTLNALNSMKIKKAGNFTFNIYNDTANSLRDGNLSLFNQAIIKKSLITDKEYNIRLSVIEKKLGIGNPGTVTNPPVDTTANPTDNPPTDTTTLPLPTDPSIDPHGNPPADPRTPDWPIKIPIRQQVKTQDNSTKFGKQPIKNQQ